MNSKTKSALVLIGTLILGIAIGALSWTAAHNRQMEEIRKLRRPGALPAVIESVVQSTDDSQRNDIREIASKYEEGLSQIYREMARARTNATDSLHHHLDLILDLDQMDKFDTWLRENRRRPRPTRRDN